MAITRRDPNTIYLGGPITRVADLHAVEAITPGMLVEIHDNAGTPAWGVHDSADTSPTSAVALEQIELNKGIDDACEAGDLIPVGILSPGSMFYGLIPSGQDIAVGDLLQSNGDGKLKAFVPSGTKIARFVSHTDSGAVTEDTRIRVEVL